MPDYDKTIDDPLDAFVFRRLADKVVDPLHSIGLTPSQITTISIVFALSSIALMIIGIPYAAMLCFLAYYILDCADGQVARKFNQTSFFGEVYDWNKDHIIGTLLLILFFFTDKVAFLSTLLMLYPMVLNIATLDAITNYRNGKKFTEFRVPQQTDGLWYGYFNSSKRVCRSAFANFFGKSNEKFVNESARLIRFFGTGTFTVITCLSMIGYSGFSLSVAFVITLCCVFLKLKSFDKINTKVQNES